MTSHRHEFDVACCDKCGRELQVVCPKDCKGADVEIRTRGNGIPKAPKFQEKQPRRCSCGAVLTHGQRRCHLCRVPKYVRRAPLPAEKRCTACGHTKPIGKFYLRLGQPFSNCKTCWNAYTSGRQKARAAAKAAR